MTTSGTRDFEPDVAEYIEEAFERCGLEFRTGYDGITARRSLNLLLAGLGQPWVKSVDDTEYVYNFNSRRRVY